MYCSHCGKWADPSAWRCRFCRKSTAAVIRNFASLAILAASGYALYWTAKVVAVWANVLASYGKAVEWWMQDAAVFVNSAMKYGLWIVGGYIVLALLLRTKTSLFASGRLAIWGAGIFALLTLAATLAVGVQGAITGGDVWHVAQEKSFTLNQLYTEAALHQVVAAENSYLAAHNGQYACNLNALQLGSIHKSAATHGYDMFLGCNGEQTNSYRLFARPVTLDVTGKVAYCSDEHGALQSVSADASGIAWGSYVQSAEKCLNTGQPVKE